MTASIFDLCSTRSACGFVSSTSSFNSLMRSATLTGGNGFGTVGAKVIFLGGELIVKMLWDDGREGGGLRGMIAFCRVG